MNEVNFPVRKITSPLSWEEVVLERQVLIENKTNAILARRCRIRR